MATDWSCRLLEVIARFVDLLGHFLTKLPLQEKVCGPYVVTLLDWTPTRVEWYLARLVVKYRNGHWNCIQYAFWNFWNGESASCKYSMVARRTDGLVEGKKKDKKIFPYLSTSMNVSMLALWWSRYSVMQHRVLCLVWEVGSGSVRLILFH